MSMQIIETDEQLIEQIQRGESEVYGQLFGKYYQRIYSVCYSILKNPHDAEEVASETFVHAYLKLDQLRKPSLFFGWLRRIAQNRSKNFLRNKRAETIPLDLASAQTATQVAPDVLLLKQELIDAIMEAIESLPPKDREVIRARINGLKYSEISEQLGISIEASKSRIYRVRKKIAEHVKDLLNSIFVLPQMPPFKKIVSGSIKAMKAGTSTNVTTGIFSATQCLMFSSILHIAVFIALSFLPSFHKYSSDGGKIEASEIFFLTSIDEQPLVPNLSKGVAKPVVSANESFSQFLKQSPSTMPRVFFTPEKRIPKDETIKIENRVGQNAEELQVGMKVDVKGVESTSDKSKRASSVLPMVAKESNSVVGKNSLGLRNRVRELAQSKSVVSSATRSKREMLTFVTPKQGALRESESFSMSRQVGTADINDVLTNVANEVRLDRTEFGVPELPKGEPGGVIVGMGRNIRGHLRFPRVDCSMLNRNLVEKYFGKSMLNLMKWINANTDIKVDMDVEGGGIKFTDRMLFKAPVIFILGHTGEMSMKNIEDTLHHWEYHPWYGQHVKVPTRLTDIERKQLREYLVQKGGILFVDAWPSLTTPVSGSGEFPWAIRMKQELEKILPGYRFERIPNNHELYSCYYALNGPPQWKFCAYYYKNSPYLEGIFIDGRLAVILSENGYSISMSGQLWASPLSSVFRMITNIVVYALTHGGISDYSRYVPDRAIPEEIPVNPPVIPPPTPSLHP